MLRAVVDVDIQLFDTEDRTAFPEGKALIAYCEEEVREINPNVLQRSDDLLSSDRLRCPAGCPAVLLRYSDVLGVFWDAYVLTCLRACKLNRADDVIRAATRASLGTTTAPPKAPRTTACSTITLGTTALVATKATST